MYGHATNRLNSQDRPDRMQGMRRRTFIKTTGALGLNAALPWADLYARARKSTEFLKEKSSDRMLFPRPDDGAKLPISPVGLAWLPCPGAADYRVEIFAKSDIASRAT